jgi:hypothetical protein
VERWRDVELIRLQEEFNQLVKLDDMFIELVNQSEDS